MPMSDELTEVSIPNFLVKVWNIVEDANYDNCIHWDDSGFSFHVADPFTFSKDVLPLYFKHNNLSSFVRQLNMYGFRKVTPLERSGLSRAQSDQEHLEFQHAYFVRGHPELLQHIKRKSTTTTTGSTGSKTGGTVGENRKSSGGMTQKGMDRILDEVHTLREKQKSWDSTLASLQKENETLWREVAAMRNLHSKQQTIVNKLIQFLLSVVQPSTPAGKRLGKRQLLAIEPDELIMGSDIPGPSGEKRTRYDSTGAVVPQLVSSAGASGTLRALQQELRRASNNGSPNPTGPIIADVTDELSSGSPMERSPSPPSLGHKSANDINSVYLSALAHALSGSFDAGGLNGSNASMTKNPSRSASARSGINASSVRSPNVTSPPEFNFDQSLPEQTLNQNALATYDPNSETTTVGLTQPSGSSSEAMIAPGATIDLNFPTGGPQMDRFGAALPRNPSNSFRTRTTSQDFSDFLEFMDSDLESLRDTINSTNSLNVNSDFLSTLFDADTNQAPAESDPQHSSHALTQSTDPLLTAVTSADHGSIVGNELALYQAPHPIVTTHAPSADQMGSTGEEDFFDLLSTETADGNVPSPGVQSSLETPVVSPRVYPVGIRGAVASNKGGKSNRMGVRSSQSGSEVNKAALNYQATNQATRQNSSIPASHVIRRSPSYSKMTGGPGSKVRRK